MMSQYFTHQIFCKNQFFTDESTASALPRFRRFSNTTACICYIRPNSQTNVSWKCPWRCCPSKDRCRIIGQLEFYIDRWLFDFLVSKCHFMARIRSPCLRTIWQNFVTSIEKVLVEHLLQCPPAGFNIIVVQGDVWIVEIDPIGHTFSHFTPRTFIGPNAFSARIIKRLHTELFNRFIAHQIESLLHFDFNRKAVCIPSTFSFDKETFHRLPSTDKVLVGSSNDVMNTWFSIRSWRSFKENEWCAFSV